MKKAALILGLLGTALFDSSAGAAEVPQSQAAEDPSLGAPVLNGAEGTNAPVERGLSPTAKAPRKLGKGRVSRSSPAPARPSEDISPRLDFTPEPELLAPGIYESRPYTCIIIAPGAHTDDRAIHNPGNSWSRQRIIRPDLRFLPRTPPPSKNSWELERRKSPGSVGE